MVTRGKRQSHEKRSDWSILILACVLMAGIMFISLVAQAR